MVENTHTITKRGATTPLRRKMKNAPGRVTKLFPLNTEYTWKVAF